MSTDSPQFLSSFSPLSPPLPPELISASQLLQWLDITACLSAELHSKNPAVTVSMDDLEFYEPVPVGSLLQITAVPTRSFNTSMEV